MPGDTPAAGSAEARAPGRRKRFGKKLRTVSRGIRIVQAPKSSRSRVIYVVRGARVRYVAIADRKLAKKRSALRRYLRQAKLG